MGVIYKLKPEIRNWIVEKKQANPGLSCRGLISLIEEEFKLKVSKSSINSLFKETGLSMPVGRRQKKRTPEEPPLALTGPQTEKLLTKLPPKTETPEETPLSFPAERAGEISRQISPEILQKIQSCGAILLKATDSLIGGSRYICDIIKQIQNLNNEHLLGKIESLIYAPLLETSQAQLKSYLNALNAAGPLVPNILRTLSQILTDVRCIKVLLSSQETLYLDGQFHTVWSVPHIPYEFAETIHNTKNYLKKSFSEDEPLVLFMAPGYERPTEEFFNFIVSLGSREHKIVGLGLYSNKLEKIEFINLRGDKNYSLIFGLWPWQFTGYRRVKKIGDFKPFCFQPQGKNFYLADIALELGGFNNNPALELFGCALKNNLSEKTRLMIVGNLTEGTVRSEYLANLYLSHWPNLEEAFQDFSRKVELFTYTADSRHLFSTETINLKQDNPGIEQLFSYYLKVLDLYFKWHFLPSGYIDKNFLTSKEEFYRLKVNFQPQKDYALATLQPPPGFTHLKALEYACRRLNEREITLPDQRLWLTL